MGILKNLKYIITGEDAELLQKQLEAYRAKLSELDSEIYKLSSSNKSLKDRINQLTQENADKADIIQRQSEKLSSLSGDAERNANSVNLVRGELTQMKRLKTTYQNKVERSKEEIEQLKLSLEDSIKQKETLEWTVKSHEDEIKNQIKIEQNLRQELSDSQKSLLDSIQQREAISQREEELKENYQSLDDEYAKLKAEVLDLYTINQQLTSTVEELKYDQVHLTSEVSTEKDKRIQAEKLNAELVALKDSLTIANETLEKEKETLIGEKTELVEKYNALVKEQEEVDFQEDVLKGVENQEEDSEEIPVVVSDESNNDAEAIVEEEEKEIVEEETEEIVDEEGPEEIPTAISDVGDNGSEDVVEEEEPVETEEMDAVKEDEMVEPDENEELEETDHTVKRTIAEIWDNQVGDVIKADEFFSRPENELIRWRRIFEESILYNENRFICPYCKQPVKISGRKFRRGEVCFFSHLHDSSFCEIKTNTGLSKEQIEARKYGLVNESERHKRLKALISQALSSDGSVQKGVTGVEVEKRIDSDIPYLNWRRPDVMANYRDMNLVFELQLSTTFISVVVQRDLFYRLNDYFIIWVFNFDENQKYVDLSNLMCKDIYYANKRNIFVFDQDAQTASRERGELVLKVNWLDTDSTWHYAIDKNGCDGKLVTLDELTYDTETAKPYYFDAETPYFELHPEVRERLLKEEKSKQEMLRLLRERESKEEEEKKAQLERARYLMLEKGESVQPFDENGKWGFKYDDKVIVPAQYLKCEALDSRGFYKVKSGRHWGLLDGQGNVLFPTLYMDFHALEGNVVVAESASGFFLSEKCKICSRRPHDVISLVTFTSRIDRFQINGSPINAFLLDQSNLLCTDSVGHQRFMDIDGICLNDCCYSQSFFTDDALSIWAKDVNSSKWALYDLDGRVLSKQEYATCDKFARNVILNYEETADVYDLNGTYLRSLPYAISQYDENDSFYLTGKGGLHGLLDKELVEIIPPLFSQIRMMKDVFYVEQDGKFGLYDKQGDELTPAIYRYIETFTDSCYLVSQDELVGLLDLKGKVILDCEYTNIEVSQNESYFICVRQQKSYIFRVSDNQLYETAYDSIENMGGNLFKVMSDNRCGLIDLDGNEVMPLQYCDIQSLEGVYRKESINLFRCYTTPTKCCAYSLKEHKVLVPDKYDDIDWLGDDYYSVCQDNKWGIYVTGKGLITGIKYRGVRSKGDERIRVSKDGILFGDIDLSGKEIISEVCQLPDGRVTQKYFGLWGLFDENGQEIFPYESSQPIEPLGNDLFKVCIKDKYGVKDLGGHFILQAKYVNIWGKAGAAFFIVATTGMVRKKKWGYGTYSYFNDEVNKYELFRLDGTQSGIPERFKGKFDSMCFITSDIVKVDFKLLYLPTMSSPSGVYDTCEHWDEKGHYLVSDHRDNSYGLLSSDFEIIVPCTKGTMTHWGNCLCLVETTVSIRNFYGWLEREEKHYHLYLADGTLCEISAFEDIDKSFDEYAEAVFNGNKGRLTADGKIIPDQTEELAPGLFVDHAFGLIAIRDAQSLPILSFSEQCDEASLLGNDAILVGKKGYYGVLTKEGRMVVPCQFRSIELWTSTIVLAVSKSDDALYSLYTLDGTCLTENKYSYISPCNNGVASVVRGSLHGAINEKGEEIYDLEEEISGGLVRRRKFEKWGLYDEQNHEILPCEYYSIELVIEGILKVTYADRYTGRSTFLYDASGNKLLPFEIFNIRVLPGNFIILSKLHSIVALYDSKFNCVVPFEQRYMTLSQWNDDLLLASTQLDSCFNLIDFKGNVVTARSYNFIGKLTDGKAEAIDSNSIHGFLDAAGHEIYDQTGTFCDGYTYRRKFSRYDLFKDDQVILTNVYDILLWSDKLLKIKINENEYRLYTLENEAYIEGTYNWIGELSGETAEVKLGNHTGKIDRHGDLSSNEEIQLDNGYRKVLSLCTWSVFNEKNEDIFKRECEEVCTFHGKLLEIQTKKCINVDLSLQTIIPVTAHFSMESPTNLTYVINTKEISINKSRVYLGKSDLKTFIEEHKVMQIVVTYKNKVDRLFGVPYEMSNDHLYAVDEIVEAVVNDINSYSIKLEIPDRSYTYIHATRLKELGFELENFHIGDKLKLRKESFDYQHCVDVWFILKQKDETKINQE